MKIRQKYICGKDEINIQYEYSKNGLIINMTEIDDHFESEEQELHMPKIEVTGEFFAKVISHPGLK